MASSAFENTKSFTSNIVGGVTTKSSELVGKGSDAVSSISEKVVSGTKNLTSKVADHQTKSIDTAWQGGKDSANFLGKHCKEKFEMQLKKANVIPKLFATKYTLKNSVFFILKANETVALSKELGSKTESAWNQTKTTANDAGEHGV